VRLNAGLDWEP